MVDVVEGPGGVSMRVEAGDREVLLNGLMLVSSLTGVAAEGRVVVDSWEVGWTALDAFRTRSHIARSRLAPASVELNRERTV